MPMIRTKIGKTVLDWTLSRLRIPWIATMVLVVLGTLGSVYAITMFYGVQLMLGGAAVLVALRLHGGKYGGMALVGIFGLKCLLLDMPYSIWVGAAIHALEFIWMLGWQKRWKNGSMMTANATFWLVLFLPIVGLGHFVFGMEMDELRFAYMHAALVGMVNALLAGIVVDFWITHSEHPMKRAGAIPLHRIAFKYVVAFVVSVSLVLLSADSRRQLDQIRDAIVTSLRHATDLIDKKVGVPVVPSGQLQSTLRQYSEFMDVGIIILGSDDRVVGSSSELYPVGAALPAKQERVLQAGGDPLLLSDAVASSDILDYWRQAVFINEKWQAPAEGYRLIVLSSPSKFYPHIASIYLTTIQSLLVIILISMIIAAPISKKVVSPLKRITLMTSALSRLLIRQGEMKWPISHVTEVQILIGNLRKMSDVLLEQFEQIRQDKITLEDRVRERTKELRNSEEIKRAIVDSSIEAIIAVDACGKIIEFNPEAERMFGLRREDVVYQKNAPSLFQGATCDEIKQKLERREFNTGKRHTHIEEIYGIRRDGSVFPIEYKIVEIRLGNKESLYNLFIKDITERTRAEEDRVRDALALEQLNAELVREKQAIQEQRDISEQFIESVREGLVMSDRSGTITIVNRRIEEMFGLGDFLGRSIEDLALSIERSVLTDNFNLLDQTRAFLKGEQAFAETEFVLDNASKSVFSLYMKQIDVPGRNHGFLLVFRDRTEEEHLNRMKHELISVVSHELRTPVATIMGYVELMMLYDLPASQRLEFLGKITSEGARLSSLLDDVLDIQRLDNGSLTYHMTYVPMLELVEGVAEQWNIKSVQRIYVHAFNGDFFAYADQNRMAQVLHNLVGNAVKYSPGADRIDITLWEEKKWLCIDVRDYGIGIAEEVQDMLFTKFYRVDNSDHRQIGGTGLGLYISRKIVEDHHGKLTVMSAPGKGSTFKVRLPKQEALV